MANPDTDDAALGALPSPSCTLVVPALDEAAAVDHLVTVATAVLATDLFTRVVVLDGGSQDDTVARARRAGLEVVAATDLPPGPPVLGKGDSLWRAADLPGDVLVFRDADVEGVDADDLVVLATAATRAGVALAKGSFDRLQYAEGPPRPVSGRITEFVARPLLGLLRPDLDHVDEPLSGQFAIRRDVLRALPMATRYGVDVGLVLAVADRWGPMAVTSVPVGPVTHRAKQDASLVPMAHDVTAAIMGLAGRPDGARGDGADDAAPVAARLPCAGPQGWMVLRPPREQFTGVTPTGEPGDADGVEARGRAVQ